MGIEGFFRLILWPAVSTVLFIGVTWIVIWFILRWLPQRSEIKNTKKWVKRTGVILTVVAVLVFIIFVISAATANLTPRSTIDRSGVEQQIDKFEQKIEGGN
jgi:hypothetical protein